MWLLRLVFFSFSLIKNRVCSVCGLYVEYECGVCVYDVGSCVCSCMPIPMSKGDGQGPCSRLSNTISNLIPVKLYSCCVPSCMH